MRLDFYYILMAFLILFVFCLITFYTFFAFADERSIISEQDSFQGTQVGVPPGKDNVQGEQPIQIRSKDLKRSLNSRDSQNSNDSSPRLVNKDCKMVSGVLKCKPSSKTREIKTH